MHQSMFANIVSGKNSTNDLCISMTDPDVSHDLGWVAEKTMQDFRSHFDCEVAMILVKKGWCKTAVNPTAFLVNDS